MDDDHIDDIYDYFTESETDDLRVAVRELGGDYTDEEILLVRIMFISEMANWRLSDSLILLNQQAQASRISEERCYCSFGDLQRGDLFSRAAWA